MSKKIIFVDRAINRAQTGLIFLTECLEKIVKGPTDPAFSRSIYILFSYNFELILKSLIILNRKTENEKDLFKGINHHDLERLAEELTADSLKKINIKSIEKEKNSAFIEYKIQTINNEDIIVQDFTDVRYDFTKDILRNIDPNESSRIKKEIDILLKMIEEIRKLT